MAYTRYNFKTKKALLEALKAGHQIAVYQPSPFGDQPVPDGTVYLEGPHYPEPHRWYAKGMCKNGILLSAKCLLAAVSASLIMGCATPVCVYKDIHFYDREACLDLADELSDDCCELAELDDMAFHQATGRVRR